MKARHYLFVALLLLCFNFSKGQNKADHFLSIIDTTSNRSIKLNNIDSLFNFYKNTNVEKAVLYGEHFINLAIKMQEYEKAIERTITIFYKINIQLGQTERAMKLAKKAEKLLSNTTDTYLTGGIHLKKGGGYFNQNNYQEAINSYNKAINSYGTSDSIYTADAIFFRGQANFELGNFLESINDYKLASKYYENLGDKDYMFYTMASAISVNGINGFTEKAISERDQLIKKKLKINFLNGLSVDYYNQFSSYGKTENREKQEEYILKSIEHSIKEKDLYNNSCLIYSTLSEFYSDSDLKKSKEYLDKAFELLGTEDKTNNNYQKYRRAKANYLFKTNRLDSALTLYLRSLKDAVKSKNSHTILKINENIATIYEAKGDYKKFSEHYKRYTFIKDSIFNRTKTNALAYYQTLYETERKELEINQQQNDIISLANENRRKQNLILFGGIGLVLIFLIILLYRNRSYLKKKHQLSQHYSQNLLLSQEEERKRISKDLHDSLGQHLLLVKNKLTPSKDNTAKDLLNDAIEEMRNISRILYPFQLKEIGITSTINNLIEQLDENSPDTYIFGDIENIDGILTMEEELNLFRIIQECLSNIIKHANAQSAKIQLEKKQHEIIMTLQDNGVGFDFSKNFNNLKSLGLKTIKDRVKFLNGILNVESFQGKGSTFKITIQTT
ncbi:MAG: hypothetical protein JXR05_05455 [Flavobacteriaceae bacterium]